MSPSSEPPLEGGGQRSIDKAKNRDGTGTGRVRHRRNKEGIGFVVRGRGTGSYGAPAHPREKTSS